MSLLALILVLVIVGVLLWAINAYIPMEPSIKRLLNIAVVIVVVLWIISKTGLLDPIAGITI